MDYRSYQYYNPYTSIVNPTYAPPQSVQQPQIRSGGIVTVANEDEAKDRLVSEMEGMMNEVSPEAQHAIQRAISALNME